MAAQQAAHRSALRPAPFEAAAGYRILQRITVAIRSQIDMSRVLDGLVADAGRLLALRLCALARWNEAGDALQVTHEFRRDLGASSLTLMGRRFSPHPDPQDQGFARLIFTDHRPLVRPAVAHGSPEEPALPSSLAGLEGSALVIAPLVSDQRTAGLLLAARSPDLPAWDEAELEFLHAMTDLAAVALKHAALRHRVRRLCAFSSEIRAPREPGLLLRRLVETAVASLRASGGMAGLREGSHMICHEVRRGSSWHPLELRFGPGQGLPGWCWSQRAPCVSNDVAQDSRADADQIRNLGVSSSLTVPLVDRAGEVTGFLELHDKSAGLSFGEDDIVLAAALAHQAALALENLER